MMQLTAHVADGLADKINELSAKHGQQITADAVRSASGGYTMDDGSLTVSPAVVLTLRGDRARVSALKDIVSAQLDQEAGNVLRMPTVKELHAGGDNLVSAASFGVSGLSDSQITAFFKDLAAITDGRGKRIFTGYMPGAEDIYIAGHFYDGDFKAEVVKAEQQVEAVMDKHGVTSFRMQDMFVPTYKRGQAVEQSRFAQDVRDHLASRIATASAASPSSVSQRANTAASLAQRADASRRMMAARDSIYKTLEEFRDEKPMTIAQAMKDIGADMEVSTKKKVNQAFRAALDNKTAQLKALSPEDRAIVKEAVSSVKSQAKEMVAAEKAALSGWKRQVRATASRIKEGYDPQRVSDEIDAAELLGYIEQGSAAKP
jgi:hypothetical protein